MPTQMEIAEHLDLSQKAVSELVNRLGFDWRNDRMDRIRVAYIRELRAAAAGHRSSSGEDLVAERIQTERVERELKQLDLAERKGQLVSVAQLEPELVQMVVAFRTEVLGLPDKLKTELDALHGVDVDHDLITRHVHDCLAQLARYDPERAGADPSVGGPGGPAAEDEHGGLGEDLPPPVAEVHGSAGPVQP